jgi:serine/threonine protein kinase
MPNGSDPPSPSLTGVVLSERFRVRRRLGEGGMAAVYEVEHAITRRLGALKLLQPRYAASAEAVERMIREASAAGRIASPHIVETYDAGRLESGEPYIFMELLLGESLESALSHRGRLPFSEAIEIAQQAAAGLSAAHAAGIVHRDIKPANLFLVSGPRPFVKILDFGISKFSGRGLKTLTKEGHALGTFSYMPPEQMMGAKRVDERADIYALGVVLYECVTGQPPFYAASLPELTRAMLDGNYVSVARQRADAPPAFDQVLAKCLKAEPKARYANMRELAAELARVGGQSLVARTLAIGTPAAADNKAAGEAPAKAMKRDLGATLYGETVMPHSPKKPR